VNKFFLKVAQWVAFLYLTSGLARVWYKFCQWRDERGKRTPIRRFDDLDVLVEYVRTLKWRADSWRELWDSVNSPEAVQWRADNDPKRFIGDCDEFGVYQAAVLNNELKDDALWSGAEIAGANLLTVMWVKTGGREWAGNHNGFGGHNVCLISYRDGNFAYMDYGYPSVKRATVQEVVEDVRIRYAQEYQPIGWAVSDPLTLKVIKAART